VAGQLHGCLVRGQAILLRAPDTKECRLEPYGVEASSWTTKDAERQLRVTEAVEALDALVATYDVFEDRGRRTAPGATHTREIRDAEDTNDVAPADEPAG
jgi:hypothetical protein